MTLLRRLSQNLAALPDKAVRVIGTLPTTNLRIVITLGCVVATAGAYLGIGLLVSIRMPLPNALPVAPWEPSGEWLTFLAAMSGIDVLQFASKRLTQKNGEPPSEKA